MPTKRKKKTSKTRRGRPAKKSREYLARRDARIEELFLAEGIDDTRLIALRMLREKTLEATTEDAGIQAVREVVAAIKGRIAAMRRGDADAGAVTTRLDALERERDRLKADRTWLLVVADGEPDAKGNDATVETYFDTPSGPMISRRPKWPAGKRIDARTQASRLAVKIADLDVVIMELKGAMETEATRGSQPGLVIVTSDKPIGQLIKENLFVGRFGKKGGGDSGSGGAASGGG